MFPLFILLLQDQAETSWLVAHEKIYSVMTVLLLILGAILTYLILTERKVKRLEDQMKDLHTD